MTGEPNLFETAQCLCLASRRAARAITRRFEAALRPHGIKATQFTLLAALALKGPQPIGALAEFIGLDRTTLTRNLAVAAEQSLVRIVSGEDGRARVASITARGRKTLRRAFSAWRETQHELTNAVGVAAADSLRRLSRKPPVRNGSRAYMTGSTGQPARIQRMIAP
ncbi:MAG TPA: MarR family winged helix-turn-helix transcriptional regulator [Rhizomicrobium sp.]|jgi:DNA-binding MarR family transcriptional regulator|nr:MarR family winged helix-turn-helix transcriptional regulator [Rhizomicrobium sp.]